MCPGIGASIKNSLLRYKNRPCRERKHRSGGEKQKGSRGIRRGQGYRLVFQFPIRELVFGLFWLLGYQFSPRLADAGASVFWRMDHDADYGVLNDIARGQSDPR
ncbi:hypothetical protein DL514_24020, partial [Shigella sonnei]|nr:hypothetical protein [Shigella sonnei]EFF9378798.1 Tn3 family transposase [Escherichia coli]EFV7709185.1 Tn3 family transposase [Shigella sonnei]EFX8655526.1 hypothetical protein [Shigella sonnei]EFY0185467.1 hypothetical protein [Shigella sonnei]